MLFPELGFVEAEQRQDGSVCFSQFVVVFLAKLAVLGAGADAYRQGGFEAAGSSISTRTPLTSRSDAPPLLVPQRQIQRQRTNR
jgi:hypothetical protein